MHHYYHIVYLLFLLIECVPNLILNYIGWLIWIIYLMGFNEILQNQELATMHAAKAFSDFINKKSCRRPEVRIVYVSTESAQHCRKTDLCQLLTYIYSEISKSELWNSHNSGVLYCYKNLKKRQNIQLESIIFQLNKKINSSLS